MLPLPPHYSAELEYFIKKCMILNPKKRPTATQLLKSATLKK